jgi:hypothetical protein
MTERGRFVLKYGVLKWGLPTGVAAGMFMTWNTFGGNIGGYLSPMVPLILGIGIVFGVLGGICWGYVTWAILGGGSRKG